MSSIVTRIERKLRRITSVFYCVRLGPESAIKKVKKSPHTLMAWLDLFRTLELQLSPSCQNLIKSHKLSRDGVIVSFAAEIQEKAGPKLAKAADQLGIENASDMIPEVVDELIRWKTIIQCRDTHATGGYFQDAETVMEWQWHNVIYPIIKDADFDCVLELAPGHGRNTEHLRKFARAIHLIDVNQSCVDACYQRFGKHKDGCKFFYYLTDGKSLEGVANESMTFVYSFDSMVHFDKLVVKDYVKEISRVLKNGGTAFLHHSNFGAFMPDSDWAHNAGTRSDMSAELMRAFASESRLAVEFQRTSGISDGWGMDDIDCLTLLKKTNV